MTTDPHKPQPSSDENMFSLDDLDKIIEAEDPNFKNEMDGIKEVAGEINAEINADIETLDLDPDMEPTKKNEAEDGDEVGGRHKFNFFKKVANLRFKIKSWIQIKKTAFRTRVILAFDQLIQFIRHGIPERLRYMRSQAKTYAQAIKTFFVTQLTAFKKLTRAQKLGLIFIIFASLSSLFLLSRVMVGSFLPQFTDPLVHSLADGAHSVHAYKDKSELQEFFQAFPEVEYTVLLNKVIVNLRRDENSGKNPMGVYEIYIAVDSQDTAIEVKDRELEIMDTVQRAIETFSYSEVSSTVGKARMKSLIREKVNQMLNQGQVLRIYFNTFISSP